MKTRRLLDQTLAPDGQTMALYEHDGVYSIRVGGIELMSTRRHASEEKLAELACAPVRRRPCARVLIGGLGFGFTLQAALAALAPDAEVLLAELSAAVIAWNREPAYGLAAGALADPRVTIHRRDVADVIAESRGAFDSIVLDVDNGPAALTTELNRRLYEAAGLRAIRKALRTGGVLGVWSAAPAPAFEKLLAKQGFTVEVHRCRAHAGGGARHIIFLASV